MPELPEVETIVRGLAPRLTGRRILAAEFPCERVLRGPMDGLAGLCIASVRRSGKFIVLTFDNARSLEIHLGMTGKLLVNGQPGPYTRALFTLDDGLLLFDDIRQFGRLELSEAGYGRTAGLGPDPLELDAESFTRMVRSRPSRIKALLLNQAFLRGLGNIYTDEALHRAGIHPLAVSGRLSRVRCLRLHESIGEVLRESIDHGGSSISDYVDAEGRRGGFQLLHRVYGREGQPCLACGTLLKRSVVAQRGTHFCPQCQKR